MAAKAVRGDAMSLDAPPAPIWQPEPGRVGAGTLRLGLGSELQLLGLESGSGTGSEFGSGLGLDEIGIAEAVM